MAPASDHKIVTYDNWFPVSSLLWIARIGYAGRGMFFLLLGIFSALAALGMGWQPVGTTGALRSMLGSPVGWIFVIVQAIGLFCFATFRSIEAIFDIHNYGNDWGGTLRRAGLGISGVFYICFGAIAASVIMGWGVDRTSDESARDWTGWLMSLPAGVWIVGIIGAFVIATGVGLTVGGVRAAFQRRVEFESEERPYIVMLGRIGFIARSVILMLIGSFLIYSAITVDPNQAQGFAGALRTIEHQTYGSVLLGFMATGLLCFGAFGISEAIFADIKKHGARYGVPH